MITLTLRPLVHGAERVRRFAHHLIRVLPAVHEGPGGSSPTFRLFDDLVKLKRSAVLIGLLAMAMAVQAGCSRATESAPHTVVPHIWMGIDTSGSMAARARLAAAKRAADTWASQLSTNGVKIELFEVTDTVESLRSVEVRGPTDIEILRAAIADLDVRSRETDFRKVDEGIACSVMERLRPDEAFGLLLFTDGVPGNAEDLSAQALGEKSFAVSRGVLAIIAGSVPGIDALRRVVAAGWAGQTAADPTRSSKLAALRASHLAWHTPPSSEIEVPIGLWGDMQPGRLSVEFGNDGPLGRLFQFAAQSDSAVEVHATPPSLVVPAGERRSVTLEVAPRSGVLATTLTLIAKDPNGVSRSAAVHVTLRPRSWLGSNWGGVLAAVAGALVIVAPFMVMSGRAVRLAPLGEVAVGVALRRGDSVPLSMFKAGFPGRLRRCWRGLRVRADDGDLRLSGMPLPAGRWKPYQRRDLLEAGGAVIALDIVGPAATAALDFSSSGGLDELR